MRVVVLVVLAMALIVGGDAAGTVLTRAGVPQGFVAWTRFALAAVIVLPFVGLQRGEVRQFTDLRLWLRAALIAGGIVFILTALRTEPMANVFGGFFVGPIVAYILGALLLKERVTRLRSVLLAVSFAGVLIVVRPGGEMGIGMLFALIAGTFHGSYLVATRWLAGEFRPRFLLWSQLVIGTVLLIPFAWSEVPPLGLSGMILLILSALGSAGGNLILVIVNRTTPASVVAPLIYSQLVAAMIYGLAVFGQWPDATSLLGLVVIMAAGIASVAIAGRGR